MPQGYTSLLTVLGRDDRNDPETVFFSFVTLAHRRIRFVDVTAMRALGWCLYFSAVEVHLEVLGLSTLVHLEVPGLSTLS